jgi:TonB-linked SusC/RagA family outer membrane protein
LWENTLNYSKSIGKNNFSILAGTSIQEYRNDNSYLSGNDFPADANVRTINAANTIFGSTARDEWSLASFFGRATYDFDGKYLLTASLRRDGSSKLANRWGTMPSVSAGWRISSESFMEGVDIVDDLKLRIGYGVNGNQEGISNYAQYGLITYSRRQPTDPLSGPASQQISYGNPDLKWETTTQTNFGVDLALLESRLIFTFDAYVKKTDDLLLDVQLGSGAGDITSIQTNAGSLENKGVELNISSVNVDKALRWNTDFNISFNRNEVTSLKFTDVYYYGRVYSNNQDVAIVKKGLPLGTFFGYVSEGVDPATGDLTFKDLNNNDILDPDDRQVIGDAQPDFTFGFTNALSFKRFDLNIFFQGSVGNDIYNATRVDLEGMFDHKNQSTAVLNRWTPENPNTDMPRAVNNINNARNSTRFVEDGSYVRLKAITLAYNFDTEFLNRLGINKLSVYTTGQNLLTFTDYSGFDPEVNAFGLSATELGVDYGTYPQAKTVTFGINLEF